MDTITRQRIYIVNARLVETPDYNDKSKLVEKLMVQRVVVEEDDTIRPKSLRSLYFSTGVVRRIAPSFKKVGVVIGDKKGHLEVGDVVEDMVGKVFHVELKDITWSGDMVSRDIPFPTAVDDEFNVTPEFEATLTAMIQASEEERAARNAENSGPPAREVAEKWSPTPEQSKAIADFLTITEGHLVNADEARDLFKTNSDSLKSIKRQVLDGTLVSYLVANGSLNIGD